MQPCDVVLLVLVFSDQLDSDMAVGASLICWYLCAANAGFLLLVLHALSNFVSKKKNYRAALNTKGSASNLQMYLNRNQKLKSAFTSFSAVCIQQFL